MRVEAIFRDFAYDLLFDEIKPSAQDCESLARAIQQAVNDWNEQKFQEDLYRREEASK